jgi:DNA processing protein
MIDRSYVTLALVPGIGRVRLDVLLKTFGSAETVLKATLEDLRAVPGISRAAATAIREAPSEMGERLVTHMDELGGVVLTPSDKRFPDTLRDIPDAPILLFALGRLELLQAPSVAIVGSRSHTRYGAEVCRHFAGGLTRAGLVVVSGMARGLDAVAHTAALDAGRAGEGATVGVLGNGLGVVYPAANRALYDRVAAAGCLLTEFPPGERPQVGNFPRRNRLIAGLCRATVVVEARDGSGALITAECALTQGREVMAIPGPITSPVSNGTNRLLQLGAKPVLGLRDVLEEYGISEIAPSVSMPSDLSDEERRVMDLLGEGLGHVDELARRLGANNAASVLAVLTSLEIRGLVTQEPGKIFRRSTVYADLS